MGYMSTVYEIWLNNWHVVLAMVVLLFNLMCKRSDVDLIRASAVTAIVYFAGVFILDFINTLPMDTAQNFRYAARLFLHACGIVLLYLLSFKGLFGIHSKVVTFAFLYNIFMQLLLHIDRNVIGLNHLDSLFGSGDVIYNSYFDGGYWWLWDWYTDSLNAAGALLLLYLLFGSYLRDSK